MAVWLGVMMWWGIGGEPSSMGAGCESSSLASEVEGVEMVVQGRVLGPNHEETNKIVGERGNILGEVWTVKVERMWKGSIGESTILIWVPENREGRWVESGRVLIFLNSSSLKKRGLWEIGRSKCSDGLRILTGQPLTSLEREALVQIGVSKDPVCQSAYVRSQGVKAWSMEEVGEIEALSQQCGFTWCNPQYCHE